jgi:Na+/H+ antiporter NhaD/arsenite permease-like protein
LALTFDPAIYFSLAFLFGIAAQFRAMDGSSFLRGILAAIEPRLGILYAVALVTFLFSPFILNDVLVLIFTPTLIKYAKDHGLDAAPLIVAEITLTNVSSSLTPIGNPQNILLWTSSGIGFGAFVAGAWPYVLASAALSAVALIPLALRTRGPKEERSPIVSWNPAVYLALVTVAVLASDLVSIPTYVPLAVGFALGFAFNSKNLSGIRHEFDVRSLLILWAFVGSVTVAAYFLTPYILPYVAPAARGEQPYSGAFLGVVSNIISNVPATQLLINTAGVSASAAPKIAVEAGLAGNLGPIASFANLLALQMAARGGVSERPSRSRWRWGWWPSSLRCCERGHSEPETLQTPFFILRIARMRL